ncbi:MAG: hypothetical protein N2318_09325 [Meiothermus sp.]|nr:hypothetical protein [Meiothermus sp.]
MTKRATAFGRTGASSSLAQRRAKTGGNEFEELVGFVRAEMELEAASEQPKHSSGSPEL